MNKFIKIIFSLLLLISLCACKSEKEESNNNESNLNLTNPMSEYTSLEELNKECDTNIVKPGVMGIADEKFFKIEGKEFVIGQYDFSISDKSFSIRSGKTKEDISGYYIDGASAFSSIKEEIDYVETDDLYLARFFNNDEQFVISLKKEEDVNLDYFKTVVEEVQLLTIFSSGE